MEVRVSVRIDEAKIKALQAAIEPSIQQAAAAVKTQIVSDQVVPKNTGELEQSAFVRKKSRSKYQIVYDTPYARRLYWNPQYDFRTDKNPNAQGLWLQSHIDGERKEYFSNAFGELFKKNAKGLVT